MTKKILVIGSANTDMVIKTKRFPLPGETILGGEFFMFAGGKGANQAVAAARLGGHVTFVSKLGKDVFGKNAMDGYQQEGIETSHLILDSNHASGIALITINQPGENTIVVAPGANAQLLPSDIDERSYLIEQASIVLVQLEIPLPTVSHILKLANQHNKRVILNPAPASPLPDEDYKYLFLITPNETEAELLTGIKVDSQDTAKQAAKKLVDKGAENVVLTLGSKGAYVLAQGYEGIVPAPQVTAVDTTAAGDVFNGALAVALSSNSTWEQAVNFACKAASLSVTKMGAQASAPYLKEMNQNLK